MKTRWNSIDDDRGVGFEICSIQDAVKVSGGPRKTFIGPQDRGRFLPTFLISGFLFAAFMQTFFYFSGTMPKSMLWSPYFFASSAFMLVSIGGPMGIVSKFGGWNTPAHAKKCMLCIGHCPACAYQIYDVAPEPDGCTVCPECGAAWRMDVGEETG